MSRRHRISDLVVGGLVICMFAGVFAAGPDIFARLDQSIYDQILRLRPPKMESQVPAALIHVDDKSLDRLGPWPWPAHTLGQVVDILRQGGARLIGLDLPFHGDRFVHGGKEVEDLRRQVPGRSDKDRPAGHPSSAPGDSRQQGRDEGLKAVKGSGNVILGLRGLLQDGPGRPMSPGPPEKAFMKSDGPFPPDARPKSFFPEALPDVPFQEALLGMGHAVLRDDEPFSTRSHSPYALLAGGLFPSYAMRLAMGYLNLDPSQVTVRPNKILLGERLIPTCRNEILLSFPADQEPLPQYNFSDILVANKAPAGMKDKIVLISMRGVGQQGLDIPSGDSVSRGQYVAYILGNLLSASPIHRPQGAGYVEFAVLCLLGAISAFVFSQYTESVKIVWLLGICVLVLLAQGLALSFLSVWFQSGVLLASLLSLYLVLLMKHAFAMEKRLRESAGALRALGQDLQRQGLLDLAMEGYMACPTDETTRDLMYQLGLEYEQKGMNTRALDVYENLRRQGSFRDLDKRMEGLRKPGRPGGGAEVEPGRRAEGMLSDSFLRARGTVGRYRILEQVGKGTMGLVYKALDPKINRLLAIKVIRFSDEFDEETIQEIKMRFLREAEIAGQISHPSIVIIHDVGEDQDLTYMAMEYLEGKDLSYYCTKDNLLPIPKILEVVASVAEALEHAHRMDVIHRDIKPANIMLLDQGGIKVTDFGIAKAISSSKTKTGVILGTPNYMSPEQIMGHRIDARTDIFSLGVLLFNLLTGDLPFHGKNLSNLLFQITQAKHRSVRSYNPKIPKACEQIISKALSKDPNARFQTAGEMARYLRMLIAKIQEIETKMRNEGGR